MILKKVLLTSGVSIKDDYVTVVKKTDNVISLTRYIKDKVSVVNGVSDAPAFDMNADHEVMAYEHDSSINLIRVATETYDLDNLPEDLNTENAFILASFNPTTEVALYNKDKETFIGKDSNNKTRSMNNHAVHMAFYKRYSDSEVEQVIFHVNNNDDFYTDIEGIVDMGTTYERINKLSIGLTASESSVTADGIVEVTAQLKTVLDNADVAKAGIYFYLKTSCGRLSHEKIATDANGKAVFRVKADLLTAGDSIEVKAGFKYFSNIDNVTVEVV